MNATENRIQRMRELVNEIHDDKEQEHEEADELLCEALLEYGEVELVELFRQVGKIYA